MATESTQTRLYREFEARDAFDLAFHASMAYLDGLTERDVLPTDEAITDLYAFDEELPVEPTAAAEVVAMLTRFGAPATTTQLGGRSFGFVTGSATPALVRPRPWHPPPDGEPDKG